MAVTAEAPPVSPPSRGRLHWVRQHRLELALILPLCAYILLLTVAPILDSFRLSLTHRFTESFPSLENYRYLVEDPVFRQAAKNTIIVAFLSLGLQIAVGLAVALALHARFFGQGFVRTVTLIPLGVPTIVAGAVMLLVFDRSGYLNAVLFHLADLVSLIPGVEWDFRALAWLPAGGLRTLAVVAIADMWKVLPIVVLIFLAGLQSIPPDVYEAADVDGATKWQRFAWVTLPLLIPYMTMVIILRAIDAFRIFELALVLSGRVEPLMGPYIWLRYAPPTRDIFTAASSSIVLFAIIMVFIVLYLKFVASRGTAR